MNATDSGKLLHVFKISSAQLGSEIMDSAERYEKALYKYYMKKEPQDPYWREDLQKALRVTRKEGFHGDSSLGRHVPGTEIPAKTYATMTSKQILDKVTQTITDKIEKNPKSLEKMAVSSVEDVLTKRKDFKNVPGVVKLGNYINQNNSVLSQATLNGLKLELQRTYERYLGLKEGEVLVNTDNYKSGSPIFDIEIIGSDGETHIYSEVKWNLNNFRLMGINKLLQYHKGFVKDMVEGSQYDLATNTLYLKDYAIEKASLNLLKEHFKDYQPFFEGHSYDVALFTKLFIASEDKQTLYLPINAKYDESGNDDSVKYVEESIQKGKKIDNEKILDKQVSRYMLWYSK